MSSRKPRRPHRVAADFAFAAGKFAVVAMTATFVLAMAAALDLALTSPPGAGVALARTAADAQGTIALAELPKEAREVYALIGQGGPFAYDRDGVAFGNREGLLPAKARGYYREYTVRTPGVKSRGARRIVCGGPARAPDACYYTDDHYQSFRRIRE